MRIQLLMRLTDDCEKHIKLFSGYAETNLIVSIVKNKHIFKLNIRNIHVMKSSYAEFWFLGHKSKMNYVIR